MLGSHSGEDQESQAATMPAAYPGAAFDIVNEEDANNTNGIIIMTPSHLIGASSRLNDNYLVPNTISQAPAVPQLNVTNAIALPSSSSASLYQRMTLSSSPPVRGSLVNTAVAQAEPAGPASRRVSSLSMPRIQRSRSTHATPSSNRSLTPDPLSVRFSNTLADGSNMDTYSAGPRTTASTLTPRKLTRGFKPRLNYKALTVSTQSPTTLAASLDSPNNHGSPSLLGIDSSAAAMEHSPTVSSFEEEPPVLYGKLIVLGYKASLTTINPDKSRSLTTLREGGNHTFLLYRRNFPNGYRLSSTTTTTTTAATNPLASIPTPSQTNLNPFTPTNTPTATSASLATSLPATNNTREQVLQSTSPPESLNSFMFNLQLNPRDSTFISMLQPLAQLINIIPSASSISSPVATPTPPASPLPPLMPTQQRDVPPPPSLNRRAMSSPASTAAAVPGSGVGGGIGGGLPGSSPPSRSNSFVIDDAYTNNRQVLHRRESVSSKLSLVSKNSVRSGRSEEVVGVSENGFADGAQDEPQLFLPKCIAVKSPINPKQYLVHWCMPSPTTDMFQIGREPGPGIDMIVPGTSYLQTPPAPSKPQQTSANTTTRRSSSLFPIATPTAAAASRQQQTTAPTTTAPASLEKGSVLYTSDSPRLPFRLVCDRSRPFSVRVLAGSFDAAGRIVLGDGSLRFFEDASAASAAGANTTTGQDGERLKGSVGLGKVQHGLKSRAVDGFLAGSVLVWRRGESGNQSDGGWVEVSAVHGRGYGLRKGGSGGGGSEVRRGERVQNPRNNEREEGLLDDGDEEDSSGEEKMGVELRDEAVIYAGGVCFYWKSAVAIAKGSGGADGAGGKDWGLDDVAEMLKGFEEKVICPVTLENILVDHMADSIRGRSVRPWDRLLSRLSWTRSPSNGSGNNTPSKPTSNNNMSPDPTPTPSMSSEESGDQDGGASTSAKTLLTRRPWVFIACGHVVSFVEPRHHISEDGSEQSAAQSATSTSLLQSLLGPDGQQLQKRKTRCFVCRTVSGFIPLVARLHADLLTGTVTHAFDPCGHVIHEEGARFWGEVLAVPRVVVTGGVVQQGGSKPGGSKIMMKRTGSSSDGKNHHHHHHQHGVVPAEVEPVFGPVQVTSSSGMEGGPAQDSGTGWCRVCPFCAQEVYAVRKLYWTTEEDGELLL